MNDQARHLAVLRIGAESWNRHRAATMPEWIPFTGILLAGGNLAGFDLRWVQFYHSDLSSVRFHRANLNETYFWHCRLAGAEFEDITDASLAFSWCDLHGTIFRKCFGIVLCEPDCEVRGITHEEDCLEWFHTEPPTEDEEGGAK
jgi:uncharacterized protein YjbI with pentapeptide repeats